MFFKRLGTLKTKNMVKIFDKFKVNDNLKSLLEKNQADAEDFQRIENVCKQALGKLSSESEDIQFNYSGYKRYQSVHGTDILKRIKIDENSDLSLKIIRYAIGYKEATVTCAPKSGKDEINKLYAAAKNEKRRLKLIQKKIRDDLNKWESYHKKASALVDKLKTYNWGGTIGGASSTDTYSQYMSKGDRDSMEKYTVRYNNLCGDMIELKQKINQLLIDAGRDDESINNALKDIKYPKLNTKYDDFKSFEEKFEGKKLCGDKGQIQDFIKRYKEYKEFCGDPRYSSEYPEKADFKDFFTREEGKNKTKYEGTFTISGKDIADVIK